MPKVITQDKLADWLAHISQRYELWVPQEREGITLLAPYQPEAGFISLERVPQLSAKGVVFPQTECLLRYRYQKEKDNPEQVKLSLEADTSHPKTVVWGIPPCDVAGISFLERVFAGDGYHDPYFKAWRSECLIVAIACQQPATTCFCTAVGGSPVEAPGADLLLTRIDDEYVVEAITPKGAELIDNDLFAMLEEKKLRVLEQAKQTACNRLASPFSLGALPAVADKLRQTFGSPYWKEATAACISCGICTFVCPTCHCFNIADEVRGREGKRLRCWDACMFSSYSLEASGHNPRGIKFQRFRNRISHKFSYLITNNNILGCTGCGRCIRECPVSIDLRAIVAHLLKED